MCGPVRLMDAVRRGLGQARAVSLPNLRFETFGNSGWFDAEAFEVSVPAWASRDRRRPEQSMLDALAAPAST